MLCESILHILVEEGVISTEKALEAINGVVEMTRENEIGERRSASRWCSSLKRSHRPSPLKDQTRLLPFPRRGELRAPLVQCVLGEARKTVGCLLDGSVRAETADFFCGAIAPSPHRPALFPRLVQ